MLILYTYIYIQCICSNMHYVYIRNFLSSEASERSRQRKQFAGFMKLAGQPQMVGRLIRGMLADLPCKRLHRCERSTICRRFPVSPWLFYTSFCKR